MVGLSISFIRSFIRGVIRNATRYCLRGGSVLGIIVILLLAACAESLSNSAPFNSTLHAKRYLYVASGACYGGGVTLSTGSATVSRYDLETGVFAGRVVDYNLLALGDMPAGVQEFGANRLVIPIENAGGRRVDVVNKDGSGLTTYLANATALNAIVRGLVVLADSSMLVPKSSAIEKFSASRARITQGVNPYINAPAGACATSTTMMVASAILPSGQIVYAHAAATPNNKLAVIASTGYSVVGDCLAAQAAPTTTALPTSVIYHSNSGKLIAAYGSATSASNVVYSYDINTTTGAISNAVNAFSDFGIVYGPSAMTFDPTTGDIYIANGASTFNNVERFKLNANGTLTKQGSLPFIQTEIYTRCISGLKVSD